MSSDTKHYDSKTILIDRKVNSETNSTESYFNPALPPHAGVSRDDNGNIGNVCLHDYDGDNADR